MSDCWITIEYIGSGFVLQRLVDYHDESVWEYQHTELGDEWTATEPNSTREIDDTRVKERIIHITDSNIDISDIDHERLTNG